VSSLLRRLCEPHLRSLLYRGAPMRIVVSFAALFAFLTVTAQVPAQNLLTAQQWREDLHYLAGQIVKTHPGAFHHITERDFSSAIADLDTRIPTLSDHQVEVELVRLVAMLGEGHSRLSPPGLPDPMSDVPELTPFKDPRLAFHRLPVQLYAFSDGLFVVGATPNLQQLVGSEVVQIGSHPAQSALEAVQPLVNRDNDMGTLLIAPRLVVIPEVLHAMRVIADPARVTLTLRTGEGKDITSDLSPLAIGEQPQWVGIGEKSSRPNPVYWRHADENLWAEYLAESKTVFVKIHVLQDSREKTVSKFAREVGSLISSSPAERFVIDLRGCHGGDNQKFRSLLLEFLRSESLNQPGRLFVTTDRATFSAAVNAASDMERLSNSILVGEPTAGSPSSWGDPAKITLPNSGLIARISTVYWRDWTPDESRPSIAPDISTPLSSADYFAGRDPAMDAILQFPKPTDLGAVLENLLSMGAGLNTIERLYYQHKTDPVWADESTEQPMQRVGADLLSRRSYKDALTIFEINFMDYPGSLSGALEAAHAAQALNPGDAGVNNLAAALEHLKRRQ